MNGRLLLDLRDRNLPVSIGRKAANLRILADKGFQIPRTFAIPWEAHQRYLGNDVSLIEALRVELSQAILPQRKYAIRSSASIEDSLERSFAGQFKTVLDVKGVNPILQAVWGIWATALSPSVQDYLDRLPGDRQSLDMAVIVQEMVTPLYSGVAFSRNPMTGADEIVVEAVTGSGTQLVQEGVTPHRWIHKWGEWAAKSEESAIPLDVIQKVVNGTRAIARSLQQIIDLEWVYDGSQLFWVQVREISTLRDLNIYSNRISREVISGQIKPLIWSINIPLVITQWIHLLDDMVGSTGLQPDQLAKRFHHRVYFNMGVLGQIFNKAGLPSEGLEMMMGVVPKEAGRPPMRMSRGMLKLLPRLVVFFHDKWYFSRKVEKYVPQLIDEVHSINIEPIPQLDETELILAIRRLYDLIAKLAYFNIAAPLLMIMYNGMISSQLKKRGIAADQFDLIENMTEIEQYNPDGYLKELHQKYLNLDPALQDMVRQGNLPEVKQQISGEAFLSAVDKFLSQFGHLSDSGNDFSVVPWREKPEMILQMISGYIREESLASKRVSLSDIPSRNFVFNMLYRRARTFRYYREQISSAYTYGYGLFRPYFLALGKCFVHRGILDTPNDIFYLDWPVIQNIAAHPDQDFSEARGQIEYIKTDIESTRDADMPLVIYGDTPPPMIPVDSKRLRGTPTSQGYYSGPARVVRGMADFAKVQPGDVLIIPFSEVGWTPLFARAGAVVAESGGVLSHSSIIAREYRIPAVVSVPNAMKICDNQKITVDGFKGEIILHDKD